VSASGAQQLGGAKSGWAPIASSVRRFEHFICFEFKNNDTSGVAESAGVLLLPNYFLKRLTESI
jgi:hypothetical protein